MNNSFYPPNTPSGCSPVQSLLCHPPNWLSPSNTTTTATPHPTPPLHHIHTYNWAVSQIWQIFTLSVLLLLSSHHQLVVSPSKASQLSLAFCFSSPLSIFPFLIFSSLTLFFCPFRKPSCAFKIFDPVRVHSFLLSLSLSFYFSLSFSVSLSHFLPFAGRAHTHWRFYLKPSTHTHTHSRAHIETQ